MSYHRTPCPTVLMPSLILKEGRWTDSASTLNISKPGTDIKEYGGLCNVALKWQGLACYPVIKGAH